MAFSWYDPDQGRAIFEEWVSDLNNVGAILHVPAGDEVWFAGQEAFQDFAKASHSGGYLLYLVGQPMARMIAWIVYWVAWFIWKYVVVEGIYNHGLSQTKELMIRVWAWQTSLSREQLMVEAAILLSLVALYRLHLFLKKRKYLRKASIWLDHKRRQGVKVYYEGVQRVARFSLVLAAMTSHIMLIIGAAGLRLFLPGLVEMLAKPNFISLFSFYFPLFCTVTALFEFKEEKRINEVAALEGETSGNGNVSARRRSARLSSTPGKQSKTKTRHSIGSRLRRRSADSLMPAIPSSELSLEAELEDWLRFWMVRGFLEASKCLVAWATPLWFTTALVQLELLFYVWIYCLPFIQPDTIAGQTLPEARPLRVMCSYLGPYARRVVESVSGAVPFDFWQNRVVGSSRQIMSALVLVRLLKQPTADWLVHALEVGRGLVIPALSLMTPGFLTRYGVVYVQYLLSISKSYEKGETTLWLQYWVLHAFVDAALYHFASVLWWVPFSTHAIFCLWCYLSIPQSIEHWYLFVETEFKHFGLLPGEHEGTFEHTKTARLLEWIWEILPKAADADQVQAPTVEVATVEPVSIEKVGTSPATPKETENVGSPPATPKDDGSQGKESPFKDRDILAADTNSTADEEYESSDLGSPDSKGSDGKMVEVSLFFDSKPDPPLTRSKRRAAAGRS